MSSENHTTLRHHYIWKTAVPDRDGGAVHKSEEFCLYGAKWRFELIGIFSEIRNENEETWNLSMVFQKRRPYPVWRINVYVENTTSKALESVGSGVVTNLKVFSSPQEEYCVNLMTHVEMFNMRKHKYKYLSDKTLTFLITVDEAEKTLQSIGENDLGVTKSEINCLRQLSEDMENAFSNEADVDLEIVCGDRSFQVMRKILAIRSPIFASMLQTGGRYFRELKVSFDDCDSTTFAEFLKFLYTGKANISCSDIAFSLFKVAQQYKVPSLEKECVNFLTENVTADAIPRTLLIAEEHAYCELFDAVADFCIEVKWVDTEPYYEFADKYPNIAAKLEEIMEKKEEGTSEENGEDKTG